MPARSRRRRVRSVGGGRLGEVPRVVAHRDPPQGGHRTEVFIRSSKPIGDRYVVVPTSKTLDDASEVPSDAGPIELEAEVHLFEVRASHA